MRKEFLMDMYQAIRRNISYETVHDSFIGGSYRFGYETDKSDLDLFFMVCSEKDKADTEIKLKSMGFLIQNKSDSYPFVTWRLSTLIHVCLLTEQMFEQYEDKHKQIESLIQGYPILKDVARKMKKMGFKGSYVFELFDSLLNR